MLKIDEKSKSMAMKLSDSFTLIKQKPSSVLEHSRQKQQQPTPKSIKIMEELNLDFKALKGGVPLRLDG